MFHRNACLTPTGRRIMIERFAAGTPQAHVAVQMLISRSTVSKWYRLWLAQGDADLAVEYAVTDDVRSRTRGHARHGRLNPT
jgi:hypothetical protein